jgi:hypothetical protein
MNREALYSPVVDALAGINVLGGFIPAVHAGETILRYGRLRPWHRLLQTSWTYAGYNCNLACFYNIYEAGTSGRKNIRTVDRLNIPAGFCRILKAELPGGCHEIKKKVLPSSNY